MERLIVSGNLTQLPAPNAITLISYNPLYDLLTTKLIQPSFYSSWSCPKGIERDLFKAVYKTFRLTLGYGRTPELEVLFSMCTFYVHIVRVYYVHGCKSTLTFLHYVYINKQNLEHLNWRCSSRCVHFMYTSYVCTTYTGLK